MNFYQHWFPAIIIWGANIALLALLLPLLPSALSALRRRYAAGAVVVLIFAVWWSLRASIGAGQIGGMSYHLMGLALATLMLGPAAALWLGSLMMLAATLMFQGATHLPVTGLNILLTLVPPVVVSHILLQLAQRFLPAHVFVYIFINGFFAAALGIMLTGIAIIAALDGSGAFDGEVLWRNALPVFLFIAWGEAFLTGLLSAIFVALAPQWMGTFSDQRYLQHRNQIW